jgi:ligand-binding SRPBCC domain-containing protein
MPVFESRTELHATVEQLFEFLIRPANLQKIAPQEMQFVFVDPPEVIELGCRLTCKAQAYGMVQKLIYEIVEFDAPTRFREKMVEGPLRRWLHDYIIESHPSPDWVTLVNRIDFEPPGGVLGFIVTSDKILEALEDGFEHRSVELQKLFGKPKT